MDNNREKELLAEIERLREQLDEQAMTIHDEVNAERICRRLVEVVNHGRGAAELAIRTAEKLLAIGHKVVDEGAEWDGRGAWAE